MNPRLVSIAGALRDQTFPLNEHEVSIGREPANQICVRDNALSRRHCVIRKQGSRFTILDLDSYNGTLVNGVPIQEHMLEEGDRISVGNSVFAFLMSDRSARPGLEPAEFDDAHFATGATIELRREDALYLNAGKLESISPPMARLAHDLDALLKISTRITAIEDLDSVQWQLLGMIADVVPAERGAILLTREGDEEVMSSATWNWASPGRTVQVSRTVVRQVLRSKNALLANNVASDPEMRNVASLANFSVHSVLCVPLALAERVIGAIYLDTSNSALRFDKAHLELMMGISGIAALAIENARRFEALAGENERLRAAAALEHNMIGQSAEMQEVYKTIAKVAQVDSTVLLLGESGTGKELAARAIHQNSPRADKPFVAINCAALTETLLESELFGYEKGAFTGAVGQKKGQLEVADGGTAFLDEIGELAPALQAKLLRVLQEREFMRVGGTRPVKVNIRVIVATNRNLSERVKAGSFREDLFYRMNVVSLTMPPLRDRVDDIPMLAEHFAARFSEQCKRKVRGLSPEARACLLNYDWPGNVRELQNVIERAVVLGTSDVILLEDLPDTLLEAPTVREDGPTRYHSAVKHLKKDLILKAVQQCRGNYTEAAKMLGVHPNYLHRLVRNLGIKTMLAKPG
ncbi:MAG: sigma 54-interacting transcriptional regulator [Acidobacteriales bacterium]|nr:sigma 54-interacting transcriptional regulator [Terriglobales bacterium]